MKGFNKLSLPPHFAERILQNEIQFKLSDQPSGEVICNLIELYSKGVEYYESIKSYKYLYFKKKMAEIFTNDSVMQPEVKQESSGEESPISRKLKSKNEEERMEALKFKEKQEKLEKELNSKAKSTKKEAEKMMKGIEEKQRFLQTSIKNNLNIQDKALEEKLKQRKKRSFCKSFSAYGLTESTQTKQSLFNEELSPKKPTTSKNFIEKMAIEPLIVSFESVIKDDDSEDEKEKEREKVSPRKVNLINYKGRMASMGKLIE